MPVRLVFLFYRLIAGTASRRLPAKTYAFQGTTHGLWWTTSADDVPNAANPFQPVKKNAHGQGTGPTINRSLRVVLVGRVPHRGGPGSLFDGLLSHNASAIHPGIVFLKKQPDPAKSSTYITVSQASDEDYEPSTSPVAG